MRNHVSFDVINRKQSESLPLLRSAILGFPATRFHAAHARLDPAVPTIAVVQETQSPSAQVCCPWDTVLDLGPLPPSIVVDLVHSIL